MAMARSTKLVEQLQCCKLASTVLRLQASNYLYLVMEYCAGGDLAGYIRRCKRVPEVTACAVMRQLGAGLKELYTRHMVHVSASYKLHLFQEVNACCNMLGAKWNAQYPP